MADPDPFCPLDAIAHVAAQHPGARAWPVLVRKATTTGHARVPQIHSIPSHHLPHGAQGTLLAPIWAGPWPFTFTG